MTKRTLVAKIKKAGFGEAILGHNEYGGLITLSTERGIEEQVADYYGEFRGGYPWISSKLEKIAKQAGAYWEWINPAMISLYEL